MGAIDKLQSNIKLQFISFFESLTLISECENKPLEIALRFIERKLLNHNQIYLFLFEEMALYEVRLFDDDYCIDDTYNGKYISKTTIIKELKKSIEQGGATEVIANYGFGLQKFVHQAHAIGVEIPNNLLAQAQSPDCYHDESNPLTEVVKELQAQITQMRDNVGLNNNHPNTAELQAKDDKIAKLQAENDKLKRQLNERSTPANYALSVENSSYTTPFIDALNAVIQEFWINYQEHNIPPKQNTIISWIMEHYNLSRAGAKAVEQVARPAKAKTGGIKSLP